MTTDTKTQLMDAAEQQVRQKGADGFSYSDLSTAVGIRKASIHYHFPAKSDLLTAIMARYAKTVMTALDSYTRDLPTAGQRLAAFINVYRDALNEGSTLCLCVAYAVSQEGFSDATKAEIVTFRDAVSDWLINTFTDAQTDGSITGVTDPKMEASHALAVVEGAQIATRFSEDMALFDQSCSALKGRITG